MKSITIGLIACAAGVFAQAAIADPRISVAPAARPLVHKVQKFGWPDRPGGPGGTPYYAVNCEATQASCARQWEVGGYFYNRCMWLEGC
ncbi:hypothetical protein [Hyphomicrobium sp.]|uniref:hypothetical protein n=1 Tax=Hyphomicrobium sp. TaxID=82 RepID=UPI002D781F25|nr:hypothetical protein [Hyphomicrobium sp.]